MLDVPSQPSTRPTSPLHRPSCDDTVDRSDPDPAPAQIDVWAQTLVGRTLDDRYRLESVLGCGATSVVLRGVHVRLGKQVAIKVLHTARRSNRMFRARFEREALSASRLSHPNCVEIIDFGDDEGLGYFVMPFVAGKELSEIVRRGVGVARALRLFDQVLAGLEHAHQQGIIHRDIKPENILVVRDHGGREQIKLIDFGIAKVSAPDDGKNLTSLGDVFGTPQYMSPEQGRGDAVTERTDLYSAGLVLYELLTGQIAFDGDDPFEVIRRQLQDPPPPLPAEVGLIMGPLLSRLLAKNPQERFESVRDARQALAEIAERRNVRRGGATRRRIVRTGTQPALPPPVLASASGSRGEADTVPAFEPEVLERAKAPADGTVPSFDPQVLHRAVEPGGTVPVFDSDTAERMRMETSGVELRGTVPVFDSDTAERMRMETTSGMATGGYAKLAGLRPWWRRPRVAAILIATAVVLALIAHGLLRRGSVVSDVASMLLTDAETPSLVAGTIEPH